MKTTASFHESLCVHRSGPASIGLCALMLLLATGPALARDLANYAADMREDLGDRILPYWHDTTLDTTNGGYVLADDVQGRRAATEKQLVTQSRLIWTFCRVHLRGYGDEKRNYLKAAEHGYRFLMDHFLDRKNGGYFWTTDLAGKVLNDRKILYGESFVLYALVEYYRASGDKESLRRAMDLYHEVQKRAHDPKNGGWFEHFTRDWTPIMKPDPEAIVEVAGYKSANTHLHLMEALTELYEVTLDDEIKRSLEECLRLNATYFYPKDPGKSCFHRQPDWKEVTDPKSAGLSYGHNVEFAWLMIRAQKVLGAPPAWDHFYAHLNHALKYGYDHERGGKETPRFRRQLYDRPVRRRLARHGDRRRQIQKHRQSAQLEGQLPRRAGDAEIYGGLQADHPEAIGKV